MQAADVSVCCLCTDLPKSAMQEVLGHMGRPQLGQLLQEMIVAMHGVSAYPHSPSDGQV